jgi:hypothetical protein
MPGLTRIRPSRIASAGGLLASALLIACASPGPDPNALPAGPPDLSDFTGSWTARVANDAVWQGRWHLHVQGAVALLEGPDRKLRTPGLVTAGARGVVVFGPDQACPGQLAVTAGTYTYEARGQDLVFRDQSTDSCQERAIVLTDARWTREPVQAALPVRIDIVEDPGCASVTDGTASDSPPQTFLVDNKTAGIVLAMRRSAGEEVLLGQVLPGEDARIEPRRGGIRYVTDLLGRCLSFLDDASGVTLRTGARPQLTRE